MCPGVKIVFGTFIIIAIVAAITATAPYIYGMFKQRRHEWDTDIMNPKFKWPKSKKKSNPLLDD